MKRNLLTGALAMVALTATVACEGTPEPLAANGPERIVAILTGQNEVPSRNTTGYGVFEGSVNAAGTGLDYTLKINNLTNVTLAHIHSGVAGVNGGVFINLYLGPTIATVGTNHTLASGTITAASLPTGSTVTFAQLLDGLRTGQYYVNVHTTTFTGGEIRGQTASVRGIE